jgi:prepilin-type processing-associated H-X9-DG protein
MNNSYALNNYLSRDDCDKLKKVKNPSTRMLVTTSGIDHWNNTGTAGAGGGYCYHRDQMAFRHGKKGNFSFVDGHLESKKRDDIPEGPYAIYDEDFLFWKQDY